MTDLARAPRPGTAEESFSDASKPPSERPSGVNAPTRMKSRRDQPLQKRLSLELSEMSIISCRIQDFFLIAGALIPGQIKSYVWTSRDSTFPSSGVSIE